MHLYIFILFHILSSIQASGFPSCSIWAGINYKNIISHANPLVLLPPCVYSVTLFYLLLIISSKCTDFPFALLPSLLKYQILCTVLQLLLKRKMKKYTTSPTTSASACKAQVFKMSRHLVMSSYPQCRTSFLISYHVSQKYKPTLWIIQTMHTGIKKNKGTIVITIPTPSRF